jgi:hypothetical protein
MEGTTHDFRREVRGDVTQIRQDIGRLKEDQETATKFLADKILVVEQGLQSQVDSVREQTREISSAMKQVVDRVGNLPTELRNVMDTWGTIRFGALRGTPTTVSGKDMHGDIEGWIERQKQIQESNGGQQEEGDHEMNKVERQTPSPTFDINKWVNLPSSQPNPEADRPAGHDRDAEESRAMAEVTEDEVPVKVEAEECLYRMIEENHMNSQQAPMDVDTEITDHMEVDPVQRTAAPAIKVIGATPSGSLHSISPAEPAAESSESRNLPDARSQPNEQHAEVNPIPGDTPLQPVTSTQHLSTPPLAGMDSQVAEEAGRSSRSASTVVEQQVSPPVDCAVMEQNISDSSVPAPLELIHDASRSDLEPSNNPSPPNPSALVAISGSTESPSSMDNSMPTSSTETIQPDNSTLHPPMPSAIESVEASMSTQSTIENSIPDSDSTLHPPMPSSIDSVEHAMSTQSTIETSMPPSSIESISPVSQPVADSNPSPPKLPERIAAIGAHTVAPGEGQAAARLLEVPATRSPVSMPGPITRSRSRSASRSLPPVEEGKSGQVSRPISKSGRKTVSKRG